MSEVVIVGGGITGLSAAFYLSKTGIRPTLINADPRLGGVIRTEYEHDCVLEGGPDSFLASKPAVLELIREVGLADEVINSNDHLRKTYILKQGELVPLPEGLIMMVPARIRPMVTSPLLSWRSKIRMALEMFRRPTDKDEDRSVASFISDHYGPEVLDYLAEPLLAGVYGGDPANLSANSVLGRFVELEKKYGSLTRGAIATAQAQNSGSGGSLFRTLKNGLGTLIERLIPSADVVLGSAETVVAKNGRYSVRINGDWMHADQVIVAVPANRAGELVRPLSDRLGDLLGGIPYNNSTTLTLGYKKSTFDRPLRGFGFLVPKKERRFVTACTWVNNKFSFRTPDDIVLLRLFLGNNAIEQSDESLVQIARDELKAIMGIKAEPFFTKSFRWYGSMPQYTVGHNACVEQIFTLLKTLPGLYLAGNGYCGLGIPDCVKSGKEAAAQVSTALVGSLR